MGDTHLIYEFGNEPSRVTVAEVRTFFISPRLPKRTSPPPQLCHPVRKNGTFTDGRHNKTLRVRKSGHFTDDRHNKTPCVRKSGHFTDGGHNKTPHVRKSGHFTDDSHNKTPRVRKSGHFTDDGHNIKKRKNLSIFPLSYRGAVALQIIELS